MVSLPGVMRSGSSQLAGLGASAAQGSVRLPPHTPGFPHGLMVELLRTQPPLAALTQRGSEVWSTVTIDCKRRVQLQEILEQNSQESHHPTRQLFFLFASPPQGLVHVPMFIYLFFFLVVVTRSLQALLASCLFQLTGFLRTFSFSCTDFMIILLITYHPLRLISQQLLLPAPSV